MNPGELLKWFDNLTITVIGTLVLLVPGFIAVKVDQVVRPQAVRTALDVFLEVVIYSTINVVIWSRVVNLTGLHSLPATTGQWLLLIAITIPFPAFLAWLYAKLVQALAERGWIQSPLPRAWDHVFHRVARQDKYGLGVIMTLRDNRRIAGRYINPGFASSYPVDEQVLLGEVWHLDSDGLFSQPVAGSRGILVDKADILTIEFFVWPPQEFGKPQFPIGEKPTT